jgi:murein L,D-transpeptidase YcbB/YkuD
MRYLVFNPDWIVPPTILAQDVLPPMRRGENAIARKKLTILDRQGHLVSPAAIDWIRATPATFPYTLRQPPGPDNALGRVKFVFPNEHTVFLHDTPSRDRFSADQRTFSSGCIRIERPLELAELLLQGQGDWNRAKIEQVVETGQTETVFLERQVPVLVVYWTVNVTPSGERRYARDVYNLDRAVLRTLDAVGVRGVRRGE